MKRTYVTMAMACLGLWFSTWSARADEPRQADGRLPSGFAVRAGDLQLSEQLSKKILKDDRNLLTGKFALAGTGDIGNRGPARPPLTFDSLKEMLENLGYTPQAQETGAGFTRLSIAINRSNWNLRVVLAAPSNEPYVLLGVLLADNVDADAIGTDRWRDLLTLNATIVPCSFSYNAPTKSLMLSHVERNLDIRPSDLRRWIDNMVDVTIATHAQWKPFQPAAAK